jgi:hypothetical protein
MCDVLCTKKLSGGRILSLQESLFTIHEDGAINKHEGTPSNKLSVALPKSTQFLRSSIKVKAFNPQGDELEF